VEVSRDLAERHLVSTGPSDGNGGPATEGHQLDQQFSRFHQVLNRARWSSLQVSRYLLQVMVSSFLRAGGSVEIVRDETLA